MGPIVEQVEASYADKGVEFVVFDFTTDETTAAADRAADAHHVAKLYAAKKPRTGFVILVDPKSGRVVATLSAGNSVDEWNAAIEKALGGA